MTEAKRPMRTEKPGGSGEGWLGKLPKWLKLPGGKK